MVLVNAAFPYVEERLDDIVSNRDIDAIIQTRLRAPDRLRVWRITWPLLDYAELQTIRTEFITAKGGAGSFSFTPADVGSAVTVQFQSDEFEWAQLEPGRYAASTVVEEVLNGIST